MRKLWMMFLLVAGCASGPPAKVEGKYVGYFGGQLSDNKIGCSGELKQKDDIVTGTFHLMLQKDGKQEDLDCSADGSLKGDKITLRLHGKQSRLELTLTGRYLMDGEARLVGDSQMEGESGSLPFVLKRN